VSRNGSRPPAPRPLDPGLRLTFLVVATLLFLAGAIPFLLSGSTDEHFAWTIRPSLTAAFIGAGYWSSLFLVLLAARQRVWANARIAVPAPLAFSVFTLFATFRHFDRFHTGRFITWAWVVIYLVVPALLVVLTLRQLRLRGGDPPRRAPLAPWARALLTATAILLLALGLALVIAPGSTDGLWPWSLTPLTARVVGAWLIGIGVGAAQGVRENDWVRIRPGNVNYVLFGLLELVALARYPGTPDWDEPQAWLYLAGLLGLLLFGLYGLRRAGAALR
jgi:hypothetical protein